MHLPVLIKRLGNGQGFLAKSGEPLPLSAEGTTRGEAVEKLHAIVEEEIARGSEIISIPLTVRIPPEEAAPFSPDDDFMQEWLKGIAEYRRQCDAEPNPWERESQDAE